MDNSCLTKVEKTQVRDLLYKYKDAFSLRDEIGLYPNIKIEIDVTDKSPFFIRPFHANEEEKKILDKKNYMTVLLRHPKRRFLSLLLSSDAHQ